MAEAGIEVGGVEYVIDDRTGRQLYYDINALSNFVADPERVVGFNPYARLADFLIAEARKHERAARNAWARAGAGDEVWLLDAGFRRVAAQRRKRKHGDELGIREAAGAAQREDWF